MIRLEEGQISLLLISLLLTLYLVLLNVNRTKLNEVFSRARWLMAVGTALLTIQFAIQYAGGFRASSLTMGVLVNLLLFTLHANLLISPFCICNDRGASACGNGCWGQLATD